MKKQTATLTRPGPPPAAPAKPVVTAIQALAQAYESDIEDLIRIRAYEKWESAGRPTGHDVEFWHQAEEELLLGKPPAAP